MTHIAYSSGLSDCCQAEMIIVSEDKDGTIYECTECGEACERWTGRERKKKDYADKRHRRTLEE